MRLTTLWKYHSFSAPSKSKMRSGSQTRSIYLLCAGARENVLRSGQRSPEKTEKRLKVQFSNFQKIAKWHPKVLRALRLSILSFRTPLWSLKMWSKLSSYQFLWIGMQFWITCRKTRLDVYRVVDPPGKLKAPNFLEFSILKESASHHLLCAGARENCPEMAWRSPENVPKHQNFNL